MTTIGSIHISLCDALNPSCGYDLRVTDSHGRELVFTSTDPATGKLLLSVEHALGVMRRIVRQVDLGPVAQPLTGGGLLVDVDNLSTQYDDHLASQAIPAWTALCKLLEKRGILTLGELPPEPVNQMHRVVHALIRLVTLKAKEGA